MMGYYGYGTPAWMWIVGAAMTVLFWGGMAALIVYAVRALVHPRGGQDSAGEILERRLAAGQISPEDYERTRRALHG